MFNGFSFMLLISITYIYWNLYNEYEYFLYIVININVRFKNQNSN